MFFVRKLLQKSLKKKLSLANILNLLLFCSISHFVCVQSFILNEGIEGINFTIPCEQKLFDYFLFILQLQEMYQRPKTYSTRHFQTPPKTSRDSEHSTGDKSSRKFADSAHQDEQHLHSVVCDRRLWLRMKKNQKIKKKQILREALGKMIFSKSMTWANVFKKFKELLKHKAFGNQILKSGEQKIAEEIIWKTKLNLETSLIRTILKLKTSKKEKKQINLSGSSFEAQPTTNLTIYPDEISSLKVKQKEAVLALLPFVNRSIQRVIRKFKQNVQAVKIKEMYCRKVFQTIMEGPKYFIRKLRLIEKLDREHILATKRKRMQKLLERCMDRRDSIFMRNLQKYNMEVEIKKKYVMEKMIFRSKARKQMAINLWYKKTMQQYYISPLRQISLTLSQQQPHSKEAIIKVHTPKQPQPLQLQTLPTQPPQKTEILKQLFLQQALQQWQHNVRLRIACEKCAIKLACTSKISVQRAFWRLNINAYHE